ncbi:MAG: hypothetical protein HY840_03650 [Bacteroidetes bacterium]|nr:hypothetical protein [Bacteroidota bacterium]
MKNLIIATVILVYFNIGYGQNKFYSYSPSGKNISDKPLFFNVDSVLTLTNYKVTDCTYSVIDDKLANYDLDVLGETHRESFIQGIDHTFIRDIGVLVTDNINKDIDTVILKLRAFVYKDSAEARKVFYHLNGKTLSAITVPDYRIIYKVENKIYFISLKEYDPELKNELSKIINPLYDALIARKNNLYLLFHYDRRMKTNADSK